MDAGGHTYTFPPRTTIPAGGTVTLYTGTGTTTEGHHYWNMSRGVWNNAGDTVIVVDDDGEERLRHEYS
jgi:hypothetical protein